MTDLERLLAQFSAGQTKHARARSAVNGRFTQLLDSKINIGLGIRSRASRSQNALRDLLRGENGAESGFPRILKSEDCDFLGGSFDRHVKVYPLDDIDTFFPIDGSGLYYFEHKHGGPSRFHVRTDDSSLPNPLYADNDRRWTNFDGTRSSEKLLMGFKAVIEGRYPKTNVSIDGQALAEPARPTARPCRSRWLAGSSRTLYTHRHGIYALYDRYVTRSPCGTA